MDAWGFEQLHPWLELRHELPVGPLLCVITARRAGRHWSPAAARAELRRTAAAAGVRRRLPHTSSGTPTPSRWPAKAYR